MKKIFNTNVATNWISADIKNQEMPETGNDIKTVPESKTQENSSERTEESADKAKEETSDNEAENKTEVKKSSEKKSKTENAKFKLTSGKELKKRQTSILLKDSTYEKLDVLAKKNNISINSCINQILEQVLS